MLKIFRLWWLFFALAVGSFFATDAQEDTVHETQFSAKGKSKKRKKRRRARARKRKKMSIAPQLLSSLKKDNLEKVFVQRWSWLGISNFAYANDGDLGEVPFKNTTPFVPEEVPAGSVIFATAFSMDTFFNEIHPRIRNPYILVTICHAPHMSDPRYLNDPKIIAWFGSPNDVAMQSPKFTPIPLGIIRGEEWFLKRHKLYHHFNKLKKRPKTELLYGNFTLHAGFDTGRRGVYEAFKDKPFCTMASRKPFLEYMEEMSQYKFVLSPWGDIVDCYRHWEAMLVGAIPIMQSSQALESLCADLPVILVKDWSEVTEEFLNRKYEEMKGKQYNLRKLYMQYWVDKINEKKQEFFSKCSPNGGT